MPEEKAKGVGEREGEGWRGGGRGSLERGGKKGERKFSNILSRYIKIK